MEIGAVLGRVYFFATRSSQNRDQIAPSVRLLASCPALCHSRSIHAAAYMA